MYVHQDLLCPEDCLYIAGHLSPLISALQHDADDGVWRQVAETPHQMCSFDAPPITFEERVVSVV